MFLWIVSVYSFQSGLSLQPTRWHDVKTAVPVLLKSAHSFSLFLILLSECEGNAFLISSILILRGRSRLFQNRRYMNTCNGHRALQQFHVHATDLLRGIRNNIYTNGVCFLERANPTAKAPDQLWRPHSLLTTDISNILHSSKTDVSWYQPSAKTPPYAFMSWRSIRHMENCTFLGTLKMLQKATTNSVTCLSVCCMVYLAPLDREWWHFMLAVNVY